MKSYVLYQLKSYSRSYLFIPPITLYFVWVIILYAYSSNDILASYIQSAIVLFFIAAWMTMNIFRLEEKAEAHMLLVHVRQKEHYLYGKWLVCLLMLIPLVLIAHFYPIVSNSFLHPLKSTDHILSFYSHVGLGGLGIFVGSFFAASKINKSKYIWLMTALTATAALAYPKMAEVFPAGISWILLVLPPLRFFYGPLQEASSTGLPVGFMASFSLGVCYLVVGAVVTLKLFMRNEKF
ncbi:hypothetical protein IEO70_16245 [Bacillus sp. AGMB 02131]|uniref:Uncharacterized protein n=1 Tax=Peribacillus faecalis TaxID=2772559 RepID=A0A927CY66_9BACI|nr:hypothetical protein [Peribacillus faecalis]MBD3109892.1 hypothetical protein [Peribacillus faecalis]